MTIAITDIYRYPVKGLSPQPLDRVDVETGETLPFDRAYAIENGPGRFNPDRPRHLPKINFLMLMRNERLAQLRTDFDEQTQTLTIHRDGREVACGALNTSIGRHRIEQFIAANMKDDLRGAPRIVFAQAHSFSDVAAKCVHIVNRASLQELSLQCSQAVDALRFRPNLVIAGAEPWAEFGWIDKTLKVVGKVGGVKLKVFDRTVRCAATEVDPSNGTRDIAIPAVLQRAYQHSDFGVYAEVVEGGKIACGDFIEVA